MEKIPTEFLPAEKASAEELSRQLEFVRNIPLLTELLDAMIGFVLVLNRQRQAVFVNKAFRDFNREKDIEKDVIGLRYGDIMGCKHSAGSPGGCGTTKFCRECGAAKALAVALAGDESVEECRIMTEDADDGLNLLVKSRPFKHGDGDLIIFSFLDISHEKRRIFLERLFFHDVLNTAGSVKGLMDIMTEATSEEIQRYLPVARNASDNLIEQILSQRELSAAERGDLVLKPAEVRVKDLLRGIVEAFSAHEVSRSVRISLAADCGDVSIVTDAAILSRVLGNMIKNAVEAEEPGSAVTVSCLKTGSGAVFTVRNPTPMPESSRLQVFQKSFSTKGSGRGLGTYSIRLLTEKYLKGKVSFTSDKTGTVFTAVYPESI